MSTQTVLPPDFAPVLSAGKHRNPRSGGCFMEFASWLAGEKWSDHPRCTHPTLAALARMVNDCTSDDERSRLAVLIPRVIGLSSDDRRVSFVVALEAACAAIPIASEERQRALAVGLLSCDRVLGTLEPVPGLDVSTRVRLALARAPRAREWAQDFVTQNPVVTKRRADARIADSIVRIAVLGIAQACVSDTDRRLRALLETAIDAVEGLVRVSVEDGAAGASALELEEPVVRRRRHNPVP